MFDAGDVVWFNSPTAGKGKFHLCLGRDSNGPLFVFLHINSDAGFRGDLILQDGQIPGLPPSRSGQSVVSFSTIVRMGQERLAKFGARKVGQIDGQLAGDLVAFAKTTAVMTKSEKHLVVTALTALF